MGGIFSVARERMQIIFSIIGEAVGSFVALFFYFTFFVPFALIARTNDDPLRRQIDGDDFWLQREPVPTSLERAKKQG